MVHHVQGSIEMAWEMYNPIADTQLHTDRYSTGVASLVPRSTPSSILQFSNDTNTYTEAVKQVKTGKACEHSSHKWHQVDIRKTKGNSQFRRYWARFEHSITSSDSRVQTLRPTLHPPNVIHIMNVPIFSEYHIVLHAFSCILSPIPLINNTVYNLLQDTNIRNWCIAGTMHSNVELLQLQYNALNYLRFTMGSLRISMSSIPFQPVYHLVTSSKLGVLPSHTDNTCITRSTLLWK